MLTAVKRVLAGRRRTVGIVSTLVVTGAAIGAGLPFAMAGTQDGPAVGTSPSKYGTLAATHKVPPSAHKGELVKVPHVGSYGKSFSSPRTTGPTTRILNGTTVPAANYPWIVGIKMNYIVFDSNNNPSLYEGICTGTVLSPTKVLTAGHCSIGYEAAVAYVIAGRDNLTDSTGFVSQVQSTWTHPDFNAATTLAGTGAPLNDVTVLTLRQPLPATYTPVTLAPSTAVDYDEQTADVVGYGVSVNASTATPEPFVTAGTLRHAAVPIHSNANCVSNLGASSGYDSTRMLCAGTLGTSATSAGFDACGGDSGGPILVNGVEVGITDWGLGQDCAVNYYGVYERVSFYNSAIGSDKGWPGVVNSDWSGDGHSDIIARDSQGTLIEFSGSGFLADGNTGFDGGMVIGSGWNGFNKLFRVYNWNNDYQPSIMARDSSGRLWQYKWTIDPKTRLAGIGSRVQVGTGWNSFTDIMVTNNWTGNGHPNILGRNAKGDLYLYTSDLKGGWENGGIGIKIGTSWNGFNTVLTPGDWKSDGHQALIGRQASTGNLYLYESDGKGGWMNGGIGVKIGSGWNSLPIFFSPGDWDGDNKVDIVGANSAGQMALYSTDGHGNWLRGGVGYQIGTGVGWNNFTAMF